MHSRVVHPGMLFLYMLSFYLASYIAPCRAQTNKLFQWEFATTVRLPLFFLPASVVTIAPFPQSLSTSLPTCLNLPIIVKSFDPTTNSTHGTPPYYMIAFAIGKTPITTLIGTDENNLSWTVTQPVGPFHFLLIISPVNLYNGRIPTNFECSRRERQCWRDSTKQDERDR
jgi:hypothetical protein